MVIPPAKTGSERTKSRTVITTDHTNRGIRSKVIPGLRIFSAVEIKLIPPRMEAAPARCKEKIAKSTLPPAWDTIPASGGYTVHPVPAPDSISAETSRSVSEGGISQNLILLSRGKAMSGAPIIRGTSVLPNPPIVNGITKKKIIIKAWAVTTTLYSWSSPIHLVATLSSVRISSLSPVPTIADHRPKIK